MEWIEIFDISLIRSLLRSTAPIAIVGMAAALCSAAGVLNIGLEGKMLNASFAGVFGRVFEGNDEQMHNLLNKLKILPEITKVYCGHEYTLSNLRFALEVDAENIFLKDRYDECVNLRDNDQATVPSSLEIELKTNPFLRCDNRIIQENIMQKFNLNAMPVEKETFKATREWKDNA